ncbi:MAG: hypothetical protein WAO75_10390, partial [Atribacterales bacterium]
NHSGMTDKRCIPFSRHSRNLARHPHHPSFPKSFIGNPRFLLFLWVLNTVDPGLKIAGVTNEG